LNISANIIYFPMEFVHRTILADAKRGGVHIWFVVPPPPPPFCVPAHPTTSRHTKHGPRTVRVASCHVARLYRDFDTDLIVQSNYHQPRVINQSIQSHKILEAAVFNLWITRMPCMDRKLQHRVLYYKMICLKTICV
jgi:hypothetical protein